MKFKLFQMVRKTGGDYSFIGVIVTRFTKISKTKQIRYVVQNKQGLCHIFNEKQLKPSKAKPWFL